MARRAANTAGDRRLMKLDGGVTPPQRRLAFAGDEIGRSDPQQAGIGRNPRPLARAEQAVKRDALHARREVPQRDIEAGDREHRDAVAAEQMQIALDTIHEGGNAGGVRDFETPRLRRDHFIDGGGRSIAGTHS